MKEKLLKLSKKIRSSIENIIEDLDELEESLSNDQKINLMIILSNLQRGSYIVFEHAHYLEVEMKRIQRK